MVVRDERTNGKYSNIALFFVDAPDDFGPGSTTSTGLGSTAPSIGRDDRGHGASDRASRALITFAPSRGL